MRMRRKRNLVSRMERCSHLLIAEPETMHGRWLQVFNLKALCLELGCGKGRFILQTATENPDNLYVALEKDANVLVTALEAASRRNIRNLRFISALADNIPDYFDIGEVSEIYINFCDPWPQSKHIKRRLTCSRFLQLYKQVLCPNGEIRFKTDNAELFDFSLTSFIDNGFEIIEQTRDLHKTGTRGILTEYEQRFCAMGMPIYYCRVKKNEY